ncbi:MAG: HAMP domain-containing sensor histidine kinase [Gammaproteobacteria bacterium]|nr:HAMP domain-containing sensor histidine kinase [Gammaproteobacteria bacterium]
MAVRKLQSAVGPPWWRLARQSRLGLGLVFAFLLPTLALSYLGIQSVRNEAVARRQLLEDTHRSIREVVGSGIDARIAETDRVLIRELTVGQPDRATLVTRMQEAETTQPRLRPLLLLDHGGGVLYPPRGRKVSATEHRPVPPRSEFDTLLSAAEGVELLTKRPGRAAKLYAEAVTEATTEGERVLALIAKARSELKANQPRMALDTYETLISIASTLDADQARRVLIAHYQIIACYEAMADTAGTAQATIDLFRTLIKLRFIVDEDHHAFYRRKLDEILKGQSFDDASSSELANLRKQEQGQNDIARVLDSLTRVAAQLATAFLAQAAGDARYFATPNRELGVLSLAVVTGPNQSMRDKELVFVRRWHQADIALLFEDVLSERGPWVDVGVVLLDPDGRTVVGSSEEPPVDGFRKITALTNLPGWQVATFPLGGSFEATAASEVRRYGLFLLLVLGTVVAGLALAARSIAKELALSRLRAEFVSSVSHELRTPLAVIRMFAENLRAGWVSEDKKAEYYEVIDRESERLTGLIDNVLNLSKIESGTQQYKLVTTDLRALLQEILTRYRSHLKAAEVELTEELPEHPVLAAADPEAIDQVLINLLSNATKYIGDAERRVTVSLSTDTDHVQIRVADTGIGMSPEQITHIFDQYYRADVQEVRAVPGSGIGLTLVRHIIQAHGGEIRVESVPQAGSTFTIILPVIELEASS